MASGCSSILFSDFKSTVRKITLSSLAVVVLCSTTNGVAQLAMMEALPDAPSAAQSSSPPEAQSATAEQSPITVPAGTRLTLVLTNAVNSKEVRSGDKIFAQITAPVILDNQVAIPAGTYVQGTVQSLTRHGTQAEMVMQSASLVFPNGYIASAGGPVKIESDEWTAENNPTGRSKAAMILVPMIALPIGALIGSAADGKNTPTFAGMTITTPTHTGLVIGTAVGFAAGLGTSFALIARSRGFYMYAGAPMAMTLPQPVTLAKAQVSDAVQKAADQPPTPVVQPGPPPPNVIQTPTDHGTCYTPGSPGTPDVVIPGTPAIGDSPGTPATVIPGIPPTPPTPYPCP